MTPPPPELTGRVSRYKAEELFSIVKHGIKFTGMPAWPVQQRDDEVWAVVAFLRRMPEVDAAEYRRLAYGYGGDVPPQLPIDLPPHVVRQPGLGWTVPLIRRWIKVPMPGPRFREARALACS